MKELVWGLLGAVIAFCMAAFFTGGWLIEQMGGVKRTELQALCPSDAGDDNIKPQDCFNKYKAHEHQTAKHEHDNIALSYAAISHTHEEVGEHGHTFPQIPSGAVVAFDRDDGCPEGWADLGNDPQTSSRFAGRTLIAAGPRVDRANGETTLKRVFGKGGGTENVTLTEAQMPRHTHQWLGSDGRSSPGRPDTSPTEFGAKNLWTDTRPAGGSLPHNNMPPYIALYFCKKS